MVEGYSDFFIPVLFLHHFYKFEIPCKQNSYKSEYVIPLHAVFQCLRVRTLQGLPQSAKPARSVPPTPPPVLPAFSPGDSTPFVPLLLITYWRGLVGSCCHSFALPTLFVGSTLLSGVCLASLLTPSSLCSLSLLREAYAGHLLKTAILSAFSTLLPWLFFFQYHSSSSSRLYLPLYILVIVCHPLLKWKLCERSSVREQHVHCCIPNTLNKYSMYLLNK